MIANLHIEKINGKILWRDNDTEVEVPLVDIDSACEFPNNDLVVALVGTNDFPISLIGFNADGTERFRVYAPKGFIFSYLSTHPKVSMTVVCLANTPIDGWSDWHFAINPKNGALTRHCPAY